MASGSSDDNGWDRNSERAGHPEVAVDSLKNKRKGQEKPAADIGKAEVNFCPNVPGGETRGSLEAERVALLSEVKEEKGRGSDKDDAAYLLDQEVLQEPEFQNRRPALFDVSEIDLEFMRLATSKFLGELDYRTANPIKVFRTKGGVAGRKMTSVTSRLDNEVNPLGRVLTPGTTVLIQTTRTLNAERTILTVHAEVGRDGHFAGGCEGSP